MRVTISIEAKSFLDAGVIEEWANRKGYAYHATVQNGTSRSVSAKRPVKPRRKKGGHQRARLTPEVKQHIIRLAEDTSLKHKQIAKETGVSLSSVGRTLAEAGIRRRARQS